MGSAHRFFKHIKTTTLSIFLVSIAVGCTETSDTTTRQNDYAAPAVDSGNGDIILAEHGIRLGMTTPEDGRTLVGVFDFSALPAAGIHIGYVTEEGPQCICICRGDAPSTCHPAGCPDTCPQEFCSDGTFPPCTDGATEIPNLKGLFARPDRR